MDQSTRKLNIAQARESFTEIVNDVASSGQPTVVMRRGKDIVAIVPMTGMPPPRSVSVPMSNGITVRQDAKIYSLTVPVTPSVGINSLSEEK